jgi:hypothetical protein
VAHLGPDEAQPQPIGLEVAQESVGLLNEQFEQMPIGKTRTSFIMWHLAFEGDAPLYYISGYQKERKE